MKLKYNDVLIMCRASLTSNCRKSSGNRKKGTRSQYQKMGWMRMRRAAAFLWLRLTLGTLGKVTDELRLWVWETQLVLYSN
jgi:hypothetical protein